MGFKPRWQRLNHGHIERIGCQIELTAYTAAPTAAPPPGQNWNLASIILCHSPCRLKKKLCVCELLGKRNFLPEEQKVNELSQTFSRFVVCNCSNDLYICIYTPIYTYIYMGVYTVYIYTLCIYIYIHVIYI